MQASPELLGRGLTPDAWYWAVLGSHVRTPRTLPARARGTLRAVNERGFNCRTLQHFFARRRSMSLLRKVTCSVPFAVCSRPVVQRAVGPHVQILGHHG